jgi:hypothetical protein
METQEQLIARLQAELAEAKKVGFTKNFCFVNEKLNENGESKGFDVEVEISVAEALIKKAKAQNKEYGKIFLYTKFIGQKRLCNGRYELFINGKPAVKKETKKIGELAHLSAKEKDDDDINVILG